MISFLKAHVWGQIIVTLVISMAPIVELRGGIPFGAALGLTPWQVIPAAVIGNLIPAPFNILFIRKIFDFAFSIPQSVSRPIKSVNITFREEKSSGL